MLRRTSRTVLATALVIATTGFATTRPAASSEAQTERYFESIRKDPNLLVAFLLEMPKGGDLHMHLSGAIYAESFIDWAAAQKYGKGNDGDLIGACIDPKTLYLSPPPCGARGLGIWTVVRSHLLLFAGLLLFLYGLAVFIFTDWRTRNPNSSNRAEGRSAQWRRAAGFALMAAALFLTYYLTLTWATVQSEVQTVPVKAALANPELYRRIVDAFSMRNWNLSGQSGHDHFFDTFAKFGAVTDATHTGKMLAETAKRASSQREVYQELMFTPTGDRFNDAVKKLHWNEKQSPEENFQAFQAVLSPLVGDLISESMDQVKQAEKDRAESLGCAAKPHNPGCEIVQRYLFQVGRGKPKEAVFAQILLGFELSNKPDSGFVGLNLVMPEDYYIPLRDFPVHMHMLKYMHSQYPRNQYPNVHVTLHAGELVEGLVPPEELRFHVRDSVEIAGAERIGHGVDVLNETNPLELLDEMAKKNVMVEICLTSNDVILGVSGKQHPLHDYMRAGVPVALATDDEGVARSDMTHEYLRGVEDQDLTYSDLKRMARTSLVHAFISGPSLWSNAKSFTPVKDCVGVESGNAPSAACEKNLAGSPRAQLQLKLEEQFREFESRKWPAITVESSRAAER
nr:hypothetical protein [Candidatus Eisenbacteria bacterium]